MGGGGGRGVEVKEGGGGGSGVEVRGNGMKSKLKLILLFVRRSLSYQYIIALVSCFHTNYACLNLYTLANVE